ncbi:hypothetical protein BDF20DRAFT_833075 [Mycotypha africana]|uniref:uncharacterized protein n=1 Tax=Mycotypha africana TaxID=64632 RepID=UPI002301549A|nr:uncharacterized protein BDF20DRAFT_833075 [Mycotypha africana]KAI8988202.1 hypothetical protein BDF20DRAFT_833075 [Mycotypha africana]
MSQSKGLFAMFGAVAAPPKTIKKAEDIKTKEELAREAAFDAKNKNGHSTLKDLSSGGTGGGAWKTVSKRRGLALKAKTLGKTVTVSENKHHIPDDVEDVTMGGTGNKKKKKRFSPYGVSRPHNKMAATQRPGVDKRVDILVAGFEPGTEAGVVPFLILKSKKKWEPVDVKVDGQQMLLTVNDPVIARILVRLDGYIYGTQQLRVQLWQNSALPMTPMVEQTKTKKLTTIDQLRNFLLSRWNADAKYLNLDRMASDPILKKAGIKPPGTAGATAVVGPTMMKLAGEMFEEVVTISFAGNQLKNVQQISTLAQYLPNIQNLSFQDNFIKEFEGLDALSGTGKLKCLRELLLAGNPVRDHEIKMRGNDRGYVKNIVKRFPTLVLLDGIPVQLSETEAAAVHKTGRVLPLDNKPNFFDNEISQNATIDFLSKFFQKFDSDRSSLAVLYDTNAVFSVNSNVKLRAQQKIRRKERKKMMDDEERLTWNSISRNLKGKSKSKRKAISLLADLVVLTGFFFLLLIGQEGKCLFIGPEIIGSTLCRLPPTIHDLQKVDDFVVDAHQTPVGLSISLHGEFIEEENTPPFSYSRTFLLRPATPDSPTLAAGWPYIIMSDMLIVRDYIGNQGFKPQVAVPTSIFTSYPTNL